MQTLSSLGKQANFGANTVFVILAVSFLALAALFSVGSFGTRATSIRAANDEVVGTWSGYRIDFSESFAITLHDDGTAVVVRANVNTQTETALGVWWMDANSDVNVTMANPRNGSELYSYNFDYESSDGGSLSGSSYRLERVNSV